MLGPLGGSGRGMRGQKAPNAQSSIDRIVSQCRRRRKSERFGSPFRRIEVAGTGTFDSAKLYMALSKMG